MLIGQFGDHPYNEVTIVGELKIRDGQNSVRIKKNKRDTFFYSKISLN
ncbi:hypothetical protein LEP1GSC024_0615 [Leptospira noguchii str. 2001034031]|uniref:Uncharacterized protein n=1 Tax=Leptospira noguchii str. 2001034031 TaxID=1193053 RepID=M6XYH7_9LEPT|nr:hypothetical protein LEP1GSC024_0615 [Leptospira noguchii str. 2001034031]